MIEIIYYPIDEEKAKRAKAMWSFSDYIHGSETQGYKKQVDEVFDLGEQAIKQGVDSEKITWLCERFSRQYANWVNRSFDIELKCPSIMIAGGSNFPVRKKEEQNRLRNKHYELYNKIMSVKGKMQSLVNGTSIIKSGDEDAVEKLQNKLTGLENLQKEMKNKNAYYRKHKTMVGYTGLSDEDAKQIDEKIKNAYSWEKQPYPAYLLTNNNANIKNTRERLERLIKAKESGTQESEMLTNEYFRVVENTEIMRLQLFFDGKPDEHTRNILKANAFKWAPSHGAWQRQLTNNAKRSVKNIIKELNKKEE